VVFGSDILFKKNDLSLYGTCLLAHFTFPFGLKNSKMSHGGGFISISNGPITDYDSIWMAPNLENGNPVRAPIVDNFQPPISRLGESLIWVYSLSYHVE